MTVDAFEEMILKLRTGAYEAIKGYNYRGPTHLSIGQEATATGICIWSAIRWTWNTSVRLGLVRGSNTAHRRRCPKRRRVAASVSRTAGVQPETWPSSRKR